jgi:AcrR family transcriptional regulator
MNRAATEVIMQEAALRLLERDGVLAGLNLREVADEAGVNRGLVYHYFGSRRDLLRAALRADVKERMGEVASRSRLGFVDRFSGFFRSMVKHRHAVRLVTLLVLDGDRELRTMPLRQVTTERLREDLEAGTLVVEDVDAVHVAIASMVYGYVIYRDHFAAEEGVSVAELDRRFEAVLRRMLEGLHA